MNSKWEKLTASKGISSCILKDIEYVNGRKKELHELDYVNDCILQRYLNNKSNKYEYLIFIPTQFEEEEIKNIRQIGTFEITQDCINMEYKKSKLVFTIKNVRMILFEENIRNNKAKDIFLLFATEGIKDTVAKKEYNNIVKRDLLENIIMNINNRKTSFKNFLDKVHRIYSVSTQEEKEELCKLISGASWEDIEDYMYENIYEEISNEGGIWNN